jgi:hypothetical protein
LAINIDRRTQLKSSVSNKVNVGYFSSQIIIPTSIDTYREMLRQGFEHPFLSRNSKIAAIQFHLKESEEKLFTFEIALKVRFVKVKAEGIATTAGDQLTELKLYRKISWMNRIIDFPLVILGLSGLMCSLSSGNNGVLLVSLIWLLFTAYLIFGNGLWQWNLLNEMLTYPFYESTFD